MQTQKWPCQPGVVGQLIDAPHRFQCAQAVHLLLGWLRRNGISYEEAYVHVLRFENSLSLAFPASEIAALALEGDAAAGKPVPRRIRITPAFIGLLGVNGTLPLHDTQRIAAMPPGELEAGVRAFLDMLSSRMVALFCQAWSKYRPGRALDIQGQDQLLPLLLALGGAPMPGTGARTAAGAREHVAAYYTALLRTRPVSACSVCRVLADYFGVSVELEQFSGCWDRVPDARRSTLGRTRPTLGRGAMLGSRLWRHDRQVRLHIGPLSPGSLERFLPGGDAATALARTLAMFGAPSLQYEVRLILSRPSIRPVVLGPPAARSRLGWDSFLPGHGGQVARPEVRYLLQP
jgi:type VI secretion system protein ImpH